MQTPELKVSSPSALAALLNRAAAALETPADLSAEDKKHLAEDLTVEADAVSARQATVSLKGLAIDLAGTQTPTLTDSQCRHVLYAFVEQARSALSLV